ncbi:unnamed protein product [Trifolium pratense]|uniref:Uncharacterized protein n=1 Tax=Trifolium pratense TaxID=57577 RepID=A0ACB0I6I0_TRIPR|nr:unnamed protein product [Trifolium pratense]
MFPLTFLTLTREQDIMDNKIKNGFMSSTRLEAQYYGYTYGNNLISWWRRTNALYKRA